MAENSRIDDLRRRVQKDPASIAFAQLAEECRRSGGFQEAVDTCRAGLALHPEYLSARVTLGRALVELGDLDGAQTELSRVLESAPENLAAIRGLAEIYHRRGELAQALAQYRAALLLARNDPDLEETIADLSRQIEPAKPAPAGGLTMQHMQDELLKLAPPPPKPDRGVRLQADNPAKANPAKAGSHEAASTETTQFEGQVSAETTPVPFSAPTSTAAAPTSADAPEETPVPISPEPPAAAAAPNPAEAGSHEDGTLTAGADDRATRTVAALEQWLDAIHVSRDQRNS